jgi:DNA-binding transcriptional LysR family regulator
VLNLDRLESMQVFVRVAELGSFAAAAKELRLSPTMVAKHVAALEERVGAQLIRRTTRRHSITEVGRLFLERARTVLADFETAEASASELHDVARGTLRVTAPVVYGAHALAPLLGPFLREHVELTVELTLQDRLVELVEEGYDAALRTGPLPSSGLIGRPLAPLETVLAAAPAYLRERGVPRRPADLATHDCLGFTFLVHSDRWRLVGPGGEHRVRVSGRLRINEGEALRQAALAGAGIVMQSRLLLGDDLAAGRLVRVLPRYAPPSRPVHLVYPADRFRSPKLRRFVELVLRHLARKRARYQPAGV